MRYGVDMDFEAQGTIQAHVEASSPTEAWVKACKKAKEELMSTSVLGPRHTPLSVTLHVAQVEPD